ncbi:helicase-related protein [Demequina rhizosphaerae]|uniref:helicase-related protein n=1 Tax=Demequina rhizosphaerae TaxID=1638985 RepID=UPI000783C9F4|nr:helicase-related protein [Demequina rhizosphaerae]
MARDLSEVRRDYVAFVTSHLLGPAGGPAEVIADPPNRRYLMGLLFPRDADAEASLEGEGEPVDASAPTQDAPDDESAAVSDGSAAANDFLPSSMGLSFLTSAPSATVTVAAGAYTTEDAESVDGEEALPSDGGHKAPRKRRQWRRRSLAQTMSGVSATMRDEGVLDGRAMLDIVWRKYGRHSLVTVTLSNAAQAAKDGEIDQLWDDLLAQCSIVVEVADGEILDYPSPDRVSADPESAELLVQYRGVRTCAVGHGCAVRWDSELTVVHRLETTHLPTTLVPRVSAGRASGAPALSLQQLRPGGAHDEDLLEMLREFVAGYATWVAGERERAGEFTGSAAAPADRIAARLEQAVERMREGIAVLASTPTALRAFRLANEAMLRQMRHAADDLAGTRRTRSADADVNPDYSGFSPSWRAFQLAYFLTVVEGLVDPRSAARETVDLIWFPTGGGKTEAYLLVACFEIFHGRLSGARLSGTAVISRYTLSLLTTQQFQRTATTMAACEMVRRDHPGELGSVAFSIGLWVGGGTTPNKYTDAESRWEELRAASEPSDIFMLDRCPWCGTELVPARHSSDDADYGIEAGPREFRFHCTRETCPFAQRLWIHVVDEDIYDHAPTFVLGTVDKFAGLAWEPRSGTLFGDATTPPPSLIIQDEMHLLTGALGTVMGIYEAAIQQLCTVDGRPPKVVASTATIRRASSQALGLYGRALEVFPPQGLDADRSYFAEVDPAAPARLYAGIMAQGHTSDTATVHAIAALLQASTSIDGDVSERDAYWTLVAYHNSLRELGRTVTMASDDVGARLATVYSALPKREFSVEELTSNVSRFEQPRMLERLAKPLTDPEHVGLLASTNMLSVGVDVPRLALMLVNGQPKTTAEYIQATSRVGRGLVPGLVFGLYRSTRPRDRSHYENFVPYHSSLYRYVEPTSVTPFSPAARNRALHVCLVLLVRHRLGLREDSQAGDVRNHESAVRAIVEDLHEVVKQVDPPEAMATRRELNALVDEWVALARQSYDENRTLYYQSQGKGHVHLLKDHHASGGGWETPRSMRNVDQEVAITVAKAGGGQ